jgi:predicted metal-dependent enzyme (double-stranded beta helix superfamily)
MYDLQRYVADLRAIAAATGDENEILGRVAPLAKKFAAEKSAWLKPGHYETDPEQGFGVHLLHEEPDHSLAVFAIAWAPHDGFGPHDHGTWAVVVGLEGVERNVKYNRLDDRSKPGRAKLAERCTIQAGESDVVALRAKGIHAVWNDSDKVSLSLHTYGRHINHTGRLIFDLESGEVKPVVVAVK